MSNKRTSSKSSMKAKYSLTLVLGLLATFAIFSFPGFFDANAQTTESGDSPSVCTAYTENFDTSPPPTWIINNLSAPVGTTTWFLPSGTVFPAQAGANNSFVGANFNSTTGAGTISNWLILPQQALKNGDTFK
ncbi:MAG: choice-of-anchor J domain-containing protein, partial [Pyrinomonadaceae bacterium]